MRIPPIGAGTGGEPWPTLSRPNRCGIDDLAAVAVAHVRFVLQRPTLFRVMFGEPCDRNSTG
jgi:hypothetical protein